MILNKKIKSNNNTKNKNYRKAMAPNSINKKINKNKKIITLNFKKVIIIEITAKVIYQLSHKNSKSNIYQNSKYFSLKNYNKSKNKTSPFVNNYKICKPINIFSNISVNSKANYSPIKTSKIYKMIK